MKEFKLFDFLKKHASNVLFGLVLAVGIGFFVKKNFIHSSSRKTNDFLLVKETFDKCRKNELPPDEMIAQTEAILKKNPQLHAQYDGRLALLLEAQGRGAAMTAVAEPHLERTKQFLPPTYQSFGKITLLIAEEKYQDALELSQQLQEQLTQDPKAVLLSGFNLLRILSLAEATHNAELFQATWKTLQSHPSFYQLSSLLKAGEVSLKDYAMKLCH